MRKTVPKLSKTMMVALLLLVTSGYSPDPADFANLNEAARKRTKTRCA